MILEQFVDNLKPSKSLSFYRIFGQDNNLKGSLISIDLFEQILLKRQVP